MEKCLWISGASIYAIFQSKKIVYILMICIFLVCLAVCVSFPINSNNPDFAMNAYYMPGLGAVGALMFKKKWFLTPIIVFCFSFAIQCGGIIDIVTLHLNLCYAVPFLVGCLIAVLLRFVILKKDRKVPIIVLKTMSAFAAVAMIVIVLLFADPVAGNPISKGIAKSRLTQYLSEVYPDAVIQGDVYYNFIDTNYNLKFDLEGEKKYISYSHGAIRDGNVIKNLINNLNQFD